MSDLTDLPDTRHLMNMLKDSVPKSDLRKLVEEMRISTEVHGYEYYSDGYSAASGDWADRLEQLLDKG